MNWRCWKTLHKRDEEVYVMKNMKLSVKLIGAFVFVSLITLVVGFFGVSKMQTIDEADTAMYQLNTKPLGEMGDAVAAFEKMRGFVKDAFLSRYVMDRDSAEAGAFIADKIKELDQAGLQSLAKFEESIKAAEIKKEFDSLKSELAQYFSVRDRILNLVREGKKEESLTLLHGEGAKVAKTVADSMDKLFNMKIDMAKQKSDHNTEIASGAVLFMWLASGFGTLLAIGMGLYLSLSITRPINRVVSSLGDASEQVAAAAAQVSSASQYLAEGASEQAASLEETSSSLEQMSSMTKQNADNAGEAKNRMAEAQLVVQRVSGHMEDMAKAIVEITKSSEETGKIIKSIDEIAFQTNLLALNAAVEAARAGEAGAGFAVVADEVRNLAMRAADAAKNTSDLIENTIKAVRNGNELTKLTQEAFKQNMDISVKIAQLVDEIAGASQEQAHGITQINTAVAEMDKVTQQVAANAEESASASEEMNAQAEQMKSYVSDLSTVIGGSAGQTGVRGRASKAPRAKPGARLDAHKALRETKSSGKGNGKQLALASGKEVQPHQVIPFDEDELREF
jgi:methyl-accepting chemotaxis protein